jgi:hypothetical protein
VDDLSRAVARSICASTSSPALREKVAAEAERWHPGPDSAGPEDRLIGA